MSRLKYVLAAQLLFFAAWGGWLVSSRGTSAGDFYLETEPVDPRDLLAGTFVALNYPIGRPEVCAALLKGAAHTGPLYVRLADSGVRAATPEGQVPVYGATDCAKAPGPDGLWARGGLTRGPFSFGARIRYGIERFYLNENDPRRGASSGSVLAKVRLGRGHRLFLLDLVKKN